MQTAAAILENLEARATAAGTTLPKVAEGAGVSWSTIWRFRKGKSRALMSTTLERLARHLDGVEAANENGR